MEHKYKIGDKFKIISSSNRREEGDILTVEYIDEDMDLIYFQEDCGDRAWYYTFSEIGRFIKYIAFPIYEIY